MMEFRNLDGRRECGPALLRTNMFLAPQYGSNNNIHHDALKEITPNYVIVSVAGGIEEDYQYCHQLAKRSVLSTKQYGNMIVILQNDGKISISPWRGA